jgi:hypothetical protein
LSGERRVSRLRCFKKPLTCAARYRSGGTGSGVEAGTEILIEKKKSDDMELIVISPYILMEFMLVQFLNMLILFALRLIGVFSIGKHMFAEQQLCPAHSHIFGNIFIKKNL